MSTAPQVAGGTRAKGKAIRRIVESAFDFLTRAAGEIASHPKYSIINFATAIELMLKARLMMEHWTLVVEKSSEAVQKDFLEGRSKTVTPKEAIKRLRNVCNEMIPEDAQRVFEGIADHRNKVIHFYHEATSAKASPSQIEAITREQCLGWYHLERLLKHWGKPFTGYDKDIARIVRVMRKNRQYLNAVYESELPNIKEDQVTGAVFVECGGCQFGAAKVSSLADKIADHDCRVCGLKQRYIEIKCPNEACSAAIRMEADQGEKPVCENCGHEVSGAEISNALDTELHDPSDPATGKNCASCMEYHSVVQHHDTYVCTECLSVSEHIAGCQWCNELQIGGGDLEGSYYSGCEFCDGKVGWDGDKD